MLFVVAAVVLLISPLVYWLAREIHAMVSVAPGDQRQLPVLCESDGVLSRADHEGRSRTVVGIAWVASYAFALYTAMALLTASNATQRARDAPERAQDVLTGCLLATCLFWGSSVEGKLRGAPGWFAVATAWHFVAYACVFELSRELHIVLSATMLRKTLPAVVLVCSVLAVIAAIVWHAWLWNSARGRRADFLLVAAAVLAAHAAARALFSSAGSPVRVHVHHSWWAFVLSFLPVPSRSRVSFISQSLLLAIHLHGMAAFGAQPIFEAVKAA
ncbi:hypothetical protein DIPPA_08075 [Diplonema papillatum]|nr:hypothetical protein DIPPA_08075 [Diplonema papillatum]|eukprot:gene22679-34717_t